ncbi:cystathionine gamma-synthase [Rhodobium orientis]|uniref:Cystathionine gamma-synthase n=1 Tax=Rhodobium orientis TaxID=34017 RepID=A0A327JVK2_9HYPH|nr:PLP-dependent aspartate aminotransferase family protein [Rhodobium orientis]MBB4304077.1 cystathionine gamma-synthase [Rhodobium orientis]MBK5950718.1 cystathionine gamma-synthase [Rhodobium orientis]RAI29606.1 cystathionine gamma-synthase [Rhodobium orientis]
MTQASDPRIETLLAHGPGRDAASGGVVPPIQPSTTYFRNEDYALAADGHLYGRDDLPIPADLDALLARLEGVADAIALPSGMAAIAAVFRAVPRGATVLIQSGIYWGTTGFLRQFCPKNGLGMVEVDATDAAMLAAAIAREKPHLVFLEVPSNPWLRVADIEAAAQAARAAGALLAVDATVATPVHMKAASLGADIVVHSATKALNGHSDVLAGVVASDHVEADWWHAIRGERRQAGAMLGPFEAWLLIRGLRTLALRAERMAANAQAIAEFLAGHSKIEAVHYPGLKTHPDHALAISQMTGGFGGLLSFQIRGDAAATLAVAGRLELITRATSLGGVESLIEHRQSVEPPETGMPENLLRLSVGIEHVDDLIADLNNAFAAI